MSTLYRYQLSRSWAYGAGLVCWVMLNPSTADDAQDDPTIRRCIRFSQDHGWQSMVVVNLFGARSTQPKALAGMVDPVGPENDAAIRDAMSSSAAVVFAFGATTPSGVDVLGRWSVVQRLSHSLGYEPLCLGVTKNGWPRHPLYVAASQGFVQIAACV
jgi:hypothetical protein